MGSNKKLDKIIVCDWEATCWDTKEEQGIQLSEIIELGVCFLNMKTGEVSNKTSYIIRPKLSTISKFCTELTTLTQADVNKGIPLGDALNKLRKEFGSRNRVWASWGDYDRVMIQNECVRLNIEYPFDRRHINAKTLFSLYNGLNIELGLGEAIKMVGLKFEGTQHRGIDDAANTAKVLWTVLGKGR